jgi:hypothetical protein
MSDTEREMSFGEKAVGLNFNPSGDHNVQRLKSMYAETIDGLNELREAATNSEMKRMYSVAITELQTSQMWAVKACTWRS